MTATDSPLISVVIPTHERAELLERSLNSLTEQKLSPSRFEVVVVDDGSTDATGEVCERLVGELDLRYLRIANSGIAAAKNLGLFAARAPLVLFFDDDDVADEAMLEAHLDAHDAHPQENVAILGYTTWSPELEITPLMEHVTEIGQQLFFYRSIEDGDVLDHTYFWGGRSSCKRSFLAQHGAFDQELPAMEDIELGFRLARHGLAVVHARAAKSFMVRAITYDEFARRCVKRGRALWLFASRHDDPAVERYSRVSEAIEKWPSMAPSLEEKMERVRELESAHSTRGELDDGELEELHQLYRWTFEALQARGIADAAARSRDAESGRRGSATPESARPAARIEAGSANGAPREPAAAVADSIAQRGEPGSESDRPAVASPVVIFGAPRSGTTYVNGILNAHPIVEITNEARLFVWAHRALNSLDHPQVALGHKAEFTAHLERELPELIRSFYREHWPDAVVWGDKNPHYAAPEHDGVLETIARLFGGAKFIHVIRDGRDVVASLIRKSHPDGRPWVSFEDAHYAWNSHVTTGHAFAAEAGPDAVLEVRYEELVEDDVSMARKMCDFVGIDCHPRVVEFCERQRRERTPVSGPTRDLSRGADRSEWEAVLSAGGQRDESLNMLRENLERFGYTV